MLLLLTHPNPLCLQANELYVKAIAYAVRNGCSPDDLYDQILSWTNDMILDSKLLATIKSAGENPPSNYVYQQGWVLIAFGNALWQLTHDPNTEEAIVDTIMHGGDTDTNAAICGALLGAVHGINSIPLCWIETYRIAVLISMTHGSNSRVLQNSGPLMH